MEIGFFQDLMKKRYRKEDRERGAYFLFVVLSAEVGELADALKKEKSKEIGEELADISFCCVAIANYFNIDLEKILVSKYVNQDSKQISKKWGEPVEAWKGKRNTEAVT
ncbi:MAG: MazG nucleotide pyrophosphohydrolase domain-containing protein [Candidatus Bathyarchaeia archaeon]